ncbi:hypothetical protein ACG5V6_29270, partial [Streptomyces chitinivorans]
VDFTAWNTESVLARLHFVVRVPQGTELVQLTHADAERIEARLAHRYGGAFPEGYKADFPPRTAVADLQYIQGLERGEGVSD